MTIPKQIAKEIQDFQSKEVTIVPGFTFNQYRTHNTNVFYYNSKYQSGDTDDDGDRKYFLNINKNACEVCTKSIDFDTKNFRLLTAGGGNPYKTWLLERDLQYWMRDKNFGKTLNRIFKELPIYGSVVLKIIDGTPYFVDLRNFVVEQTADDLDCSNYITEIHHYTVKDFRDAAKTMKWDDSIVKDVIKKFREMRDSSHITVWERYGEVENDDGTWAYKRVFVADVEWNIYDVNQNVIATERGVTLKEEEWEGHPYWEFHMDKIAGRWLGRGVVESLREPQIRINELCNVEAKATYWAGFLGFQSRDPAINRNIKSDVKNGEVLAVDSEITPINTSIQNLPYFNNEYTKWMKNRDELSFAYDVVQGERLPAGTPLGSAQMATAQTLSYFELIQENVALDIKEMFFEVLIPQFDKDMTSEHTLRLVGQDLDQYIAFVKNQLVNDEMIRIVLSGKPFPTNADRDAAGVAIEAAIKQGKELILTIPKNTYKDLKYDVDLDITGESVDTRVRYATRFAILQAITADPTMTEDSLKRKFLMGMAEDGGLNPADLFGDVTPKSPDQMMNSQGPQAGRAGGGVSAPMVLQTGVPGKQTATI